MNNFNKPYLEPYNGRSSRHECPQCHDPQAFSRYLDGDTGAVIHPSVGRCNHESGCGYHYTPKQYYQDNPGQRVAYAPDILSRTPQRSMPPKEPGRIPREYIVNSLGYDSDFVAFLCSVFDLETLESPTIVRLMGDYYLGATKEKGVIFWQIDGNKRVRTGKMMQYDPATGKRIKDKPGIDWAHSKLKRDGVLPDDFNLVQCLFGEHLLKRHPNKVVALVESEKSALIGAGVYPEYVWLATGGRSQLSIDRLGALKGRTVIMFPDTDTDGKTYAMWREKANELEMTGCRVIVSDMLEKNASPEEKEAKIDIADWLIRQLQVSASVSKNLSAPAEQSCADTPFDAEKASQYLCDLNPNVLTLIDRLDLVSGDTGEKLRITNENNT